LSKTKKFNRFLHCFFVYNKKGAEAFASTPQTVDKVAKPCRAQIIIKYDVGQGLALAEIKSKIHL